MDHIPQGAEHGQAQAGQPAGQGENHRGAAASAGGKSISEITVTEIIAEAGVARASFYRNYATKESVITSLIADVLEDFRAGLPGDGEDFCTPENIRRSFAYFSR